VILIADRPLQAVHAGGDDCQPPCAAFLFVCLGFFSGVAQSYARYLERKPLGIMESGFLQTECYSSQPAISVKALEESNRSKHFSKSVCVFRTLITD